ncbi:cobalamin-binding protein [Thioalkalivibrio sp. ALJ24]|uniref:cobalamin-binding protein n=1 Tax=Thioalkalivibrio sp. ALJ24 TaxID=545276 RepID=UPI000364E168|nr:cobalamin-binding protein [Thioalkalivibrio sp. ALJ24]
MLYRSTLLPALLAAGALLLSPAANADDNGSISVTDDTDREVRLDTPAERIVSLAPHITEVLFAIGAGDRVIGATDHSDYPEEASNIPRIGGYTSLDLERILAKEPDLVVAWDSGNSRSHVERLRELGLTVYTSEPRGFDGVASSMERMAKLAGTGDQGRAEAERFLDEIEALRQKYADREPVPLFYQVWDQPLMTVNDDHLIAEAIAVCGGENVFGHLDRLVPRMDREAVIEADPEVIIGGGMGEDDPTWVEDWRQWDNMLAVRRDNLFFLPPSLLQRHTPRIAEGTAMMCEELQNARDRRPDSP